MSGTCWACCAGAHGSGTEALAERRLRMLRAFRAAAAQLLDALLRHMLQGLHGPSSPTALLDLQVRRCCSPACSYFSSAVAFPQPSFSVAAWKQGLPTKWGSRCLGVERAPPWQAAVLAGGM